jgi:hypothetical protein
MTSSPVSHVTIRLIKIPVGPYHYHDMGDYTEQAKEAPKVKESPGLLRYR